jgi:hypothetical protein
LPPGNYTVSIYLSGGEGKSTEAEARKYFVIQG